MTLVVALVLGAQTGAVAASARQVVAGQVDGRRVAARAWVLANLESGEYLAGKDASKKLAIASTTKVMEALFVFEGLTSTRR